MKKYKNSFLALLCLAFTFLFLVGFTACMQPNRDKLVSTEETTLEFSIREKELIIYSSFQLHVNQTEGVVFESSNESVASVDENGLVYANGFGVATITAKIENLQAECCITVVGQDILPSIEVAQDNISLVWSKNQQAGSSFELIPQVRFNGVTFTDGEFSFSSSNPAVATVDTNGKIFAKGFGDAVVSIQGSWRKIFDGTVLNKNINVTVMPNASIELTPERSTISTVNKTIDGMTYINQTSFIATVAVDGVPYDTPITYIVSDNNIVSINDNIITAKNVGVASVVAQCLVEGMEICSMPMVIEVIAPTIQPNAKAVAYNIRNNPSYVFREVEGEFISLSINGINYNNYVNAETLTLNLSEIYKNFLGDAFVEISTTKYKYQYQVQFVTHIITNENEFKDCITNKDEEIYAILSNDISFSVGDFKASSTSFSGLFDGQGHTINARGTRLTSVYGLFGRLKGELKNFALINVTVFGKESTVLGERIYEGGAVNNLYVQAKYEENSTKDYSKLDEKGTLYYCGLFNRGFVFKNVIVNIEYPQGVEESYALCAFNNVVLVENSYCFGNAFQLAKTDSSICQPNLSAFLSVNLGELTPKNGFAEFWYFDDKIIRFGDLEIDGAVAKEIIKSEQSILIDFSELVDGDIVEIRIDGISIEIPSNGELTLELNDYTENVEHTLKIYTTTGIIEQPFMFIVKEVVLDPSSERNLISEFYMSDTTNGNAYHQADFEEVKGVVNENNVAYGKSNLGDGRTNSSTMYITLSSEYLATLFADKSVFAITFDIILSTGTAKVQRGNNAELLQENATSNATVNGITYYTYDITITRTHYENYGKTGGLKLRYTGSKSDFFFVDNLALKVEEVIEPSIERNLISEFYKNDTTNGNAYHQADFEEVKGVVSENNVAYGKSNLGDGRTNSSTMYITLSSEYLATVFADENVNAIAFDIILSTGTAKVQRGNNAELLQENATSNATVNGITYYTYSITITRTHYENYGKTGGLKLRYTGSKSDFFFVDNLDVVNAEA